MKLDNNTFTDCVFDRATLVYRCVAPFTCTRCKFRDPNWRLQDLALRPFCILSRLYVEGEVSGVEQVLEDIRRGQYLSGLPVPATHPLRRSEFKALADDRVCHRVLLDFSGIYATGLFPALFDALFRAVRSGELAGGDLARKSSSTESTSPGTEPETFSPMAVCDRCGRVLRGINIGAGTTFTSLNSVYGCPCGGTGRIVDGEYVVRKEAGRLVASTPPDTLGLIQEILSRAREQKLESPEELARQIEPIAPDFADLIRQHWKVVGGLLAIIQVILGVLNVIGMKVQHEDANRQHADNNRTHLDNVQAHLDNAQAHEDRELDRRVAEEGNDIARQALHEQRRANDALERSASSSVASPAPDDAPKRIELNEVVITSSKN